MSLTPEMFFESAQTYVAAARRLREDRRQGADRTESFPTVGLVLDALAAEIALKGIIAFHRSIDESAALRKSISAAGGGNGHDLLKLVEQLSHDDRNSIIRRTVDRCGPEHDFVFVGDREELSYARQRLSVPFSFWGLLELHSKSFERWRYSHELTGELGSPSYAEGFALSCMDLLAELTGIDVLGPG